MGMFRDQNTKSQTKGMGEFLLFRPRFRSDIRLENKYLSSQKS